VYSRIMAAREMVRHARSCQFVAAVLMLPVLAACGTADSISNAPSGTPLVKPALIRSSSALPADYGPITSLVGSPNGTGVWFWDSTATQDSIFFKSPHDRLKAWTVLTTSTAPEEAASGLAVSSSGEVWLGVNSTLVELTPSTGRVQTWHIPAPTDNPGAEHYLPPALKGLHAVQALAAGPDGMVAIGMSNSSSVQLFNAGTGQFSEVSMPTTNDEPLSLAYSPDGALGVGFGNFTTHQANGAMIVPQTGHATIAVGKDAWSITSYGSSDFLLGSARPYIIRPDGGSFPLNTPTVPLDSSGNAISPALLPGGWLAAVSKIGIIAFPAVDAHVIEQGCCSRY
jgi:hypothetical protein